MTLDVSKMCAARSDQINAIDLISGPRIAKITDVKLFSETDQPIHVVLDGDSKRPWKCSKTSVRALAALYSSDASNWIGKHIEIYCDETVLWGGQQVGGIRQSRAEGITAPKRLTLTKSRQKKETVVINPLSADDIKAHYDKQDKTLEAPKSTSTPEPTPTIDRETLFQDARDNAELGAEGMRKWWSQQSKEAQGILREILDELKGIAAKADNASD